MVDFLDVLPSAEIVMESWLKGLNSVTSLVATDPVTGEAAIATALPTSGNTPYPFIRVFQIPTGLDLYNAEGAGIQDTLLQVDVFHTKKPLASTIMQTILAEVRVYGTYYRGTSHAPTSAGGGWINGMRLVNGPRMLMERDSRVVRYSSDIALNFRSA